MSDDPRGWHKVEMKDLPWITDPVKDAKKAYEYLDKIVWESDEWKAYSKEYARLVDAKENYKIALEEYRNLRKSCRDCLKFLNQSDNYKLRKEVEMDYHDILEKAYKEGKTKDE